MLAVQIKREPFADMFDLVMDNGHSEQLEPDELREWFKVRGGDVEKLEPVLDYCWNFPKWQKIVIANPRPVRRPDFSPNLDPLLEE
jgi:hypothetical protein